MQLSPVLIWPHATRTRARTEKCTHNNKYIINLFMHEYLLLHVNSRNQVAAHVFICVLALWYPCGVMCAVYVSPSGLPQKASKFYALIWWRCLLLSITANTLADTLANHWTVDMANECYIRPDNALRSQLMNEREQRTKIVFEQEN